MRSEISGTKVTRGSAKVVAFVGIMGALGNILSWLSISLAPLLPEIPLGPLSVSIALDLSHLTTFIAALYGGPAIGGLTGLVGGLVAANVFGFSKGNLVTGFALPIGKALTGVTAGLLMRALGLQSEGRHRALIVASTLLSYIPEALFTVWIFLSVLPMVFATPEMPFSTWYHIFYPIVLTILTKASIEMLTEGVILAALSTNRSFTSFVENYFATPP